MKLILVLFILAVVLIAGCTQTQQQLQSNSNLTQTEENNSGNAKTVSNVIIGNVGVYEKSGILPAGSLNINVHNGEDGSITLKYANATINGVQIGWSFLNGNDMSTTGDFNISPQSADVDMTLKAIVTSGSWTSPSSYPVSFNLYYIYNGKMMVSTGEISKQLSWS